MSFQNKYLKYKNKYLELKNNQKGGSIINTLKQQTINVDDFVRVIASDGTSIRDGQVTKKTTDKTTQLPLFLIQSKDNNQFEVLQDGNTIIKKIDKIQLLPIPIKLDNMGIKVGDTVEIIKSYNPEHNGKTAKVTNITDNYKNGYRMYLLLSDDKKISGEFSLAWDCEIKKVSEQSNKAPEQTNKVTEQEQNNKVTEQEQNNKVTEQEQINNLRERLSNLELKNERLERKLNNHYHELPTSGMRLYEEQHPFFKKS
jgi:hypothetical protein